MKSRQYGIGLKEARTYKTARMKVLVLIATLESIFACTLVKAVVKNEQHFAFQANTTREKNVLSFVFLGRKFFKQKRLKILLRDFIEAIRDIKNMVEKLCFA